MEANVNLDRAVVAVQTGETVHVLVELIAPPLAQERERPSLDLALVVDRSGSMHGEPVEAVKDAVGSLLRKLGADDRAAVVTFDDEVALPLGLAHHTESVAQRAVAAIETGGSTNLSGGWLKGVEVLEGGRPDATRRVILLTDGQANVGIVDPTKLGGLAADAARRGIGTSTIGYGWSFDEDLLSVMADGGLGNTYLAEGPESTPGIFADQFDGLAAVVAQNVSVEIRPSDEVEVLGVLNDYPATIVDGGVQVAIGDAYADEHRAVVAAMKVPGLEQLGPIVIAELVIRYALVGEQVALHAITVPIEVNVSSDPDEVASSVNAQVVEEVLVLEAVRARREARRRANEGDVDEARKLLRDMSSTLRRHASSVEQPDRLLAQADELDANVVSYDEPGDYMHASKTMWAQERSLSRRDTSRHKRS